jgi:SRSO17 transposase
MKHHQHTTPRGARTTPNDVCGWAQALARLHARIAPRFARPEPRRRALAYLQGILSSIERKNGWQLAEHAREVTPYGMQGLLSQAVWDADLVRDDLRGYVLEHLGQESAFLVIAESSFPKRGDKSAGVGVQYCGTTGQVENCQVGVFLGYVTARGHTLIDRELYLLPDWLEDAQRRDAAGIPESAGFQTKPELARRMLQRVWEAQIPIAWVVADTVYGGNLDLRGFLHAHGYAYVLAVPCNEPVGIVEPSGRRRQVHVRDVPALLLQQYEWQRLSMSEGTKGPRLFDWASVPILHQWQQDGRHWLLLRRSLSDPHDLAYYFVFGPPATTLHEMVQALGTRWHIEEDFANTKDLGLDHYEVRSFVGWYRHVTLVMLAHAFLTGICAQLAEPSAADSDTLMQASEEHEPSVVLPALLALTVPEVRHLLGRLIWPAVTSVTLVLAWSWWRRCHRSWASYYHCQRRLQAQACARSP